MIFRFFSFDRVVFGDMDGLRCVMSRGVDTIEFEVSIASICDIMLYSLWYHHAYAITEIKTILSYHSYSRTLFNPDKLIFFVMDFHTDILPWLQRHDYQLHRI